MAEKEKKEYRLKGTKFYIADDRLRKCYTKGDLVPLTATQYIAFKDQFEDPDAEAKRLKALKAADAKTKADKKEADGATERRKQELEDRQKADAKATNPPMSEPVKEAGGAN